MAVKVSVERDYPQCGLLPQRRASEQRQQAPRPRFSSLHREGLRGAGARRLTSAWSWRAPEIVVQLRLCARPLARSGRALARPRAERPQLKRDSLARARPDLELPTTLRVLITSGNNEVSSE